MENQCGLERIKRKDYWRLSKEERNKKKYYLIVEDNVVCWLGMIVGTFDAASGTVKQCKPRKMERKEEKQVSIVDQVLMESENILERYGV